jgi:hypothetical protein
VLIPLDAPGCNDQAERSELLDARRLSREPAPSRRFAVCAHAMRRIIEMRIAPREVVRAIIQPELTYPSYQDREVRVAGRLAIVYCSSESTIVTVLWRGREARWDPSEGATSVQRGAA